MIAGSSFADVIQPDLKMSDRENQVGLLSALLLGASAPIWLFICITIPVSPGFGGSPTRYLIPPVALAGISFAVNRLLRNQPNSIAWSVFLSPIIAYSALTIASFLG